MRFFDPEFRRSPSEHVLSAGQILMFTQLYTISPGLMAFCHQKLELAHFGCLIYVRSGPNSHYFHTIGDKLINPSPQGFNIITHYKGSLLKVG